MKIDEKYLIQILDESSNVLLVEPEYKRKYPPLGLAKISSYLKSKGKNVVFSKGLSGGKFDLICVSSLFTFYSEKVHKVLDETRFLYPGIPVLAGGVYASLMPNKIDDGNVFVFSGFSKILDMVVPDYSINWKVEDPWDKFSFLFTSRGCPNKCAYCAVWRLEPEQWICPTWKEHITNHHPSVMISDNNLSAQPFDHLKEVVSELIKKDKKVVFDNGFDCKHITPELAELIGRLKFTRSGMRIAFDRIEEDGTFQKAVELLKSKGVNKSQIMSYVLFNFTDSPKGADYRMRECVKLGIRPYPQQYEPLNILNRNKRFIGKLWTPNLVKAFRFFWLMSGYFIKQEFSDFMASEKCNVKLSKEDFAAYENSTLQ